MKAGKFAVAGVLVLLVAATLCADVSEARPAPNPCTNSPNIPGQTCHSPSQQEAAAKEQGHSSPPAVSASKVEPGTDPCTFDRNYGPPPGKKCNHPPPTAP